MGELLKCWGAAIVDLLRLRRGGPQEMEGSFIESWSSSGISSTPQKRSICAEVLNLLNMELPAMQKTYGTNFTDAILSQDDIAIETL